jgi:tRNA threonylcarbamoyladenosine modification (KEOPS) complex  Pcc1 subunit
MKRSAVIRIELSSERLVEVLLKALLPETKKATTARSKVSVEGEGKSLIIRAEAEDTPAFRAALNSYLRWVALVKATNEAITRFEHANQT